MQQPIASIEKQSLEATAESGLSFGRQLAGSLPSLKECMSQMASEWVERRVSTNNRRAFMKTTMLTMMIWPC